MRPTTSPLRSEDSEQSPSDADRQPSEQKHSASIFCGVYNVLTNDELNVGCGGRPGFLCSLKHLEGFRREVSDSGNGYWCILKAVKPNLKTGNPWL